jgi:hypothetical protein
VNIDQSSVLFGCWVDKRNIQRLDCSLEGRVACGWRQPNRDEDNLPVVETYAEPVNSSEFFSVQYSHVFECIADYENESEVATLKFDKFYRRKKLNKETNTLIGKSLFGYRRLKKLDIHISNLLIVDEQKQICCKNTAGP